MDQSDEPGDVSDLEDDTELFNVSNREVITAMIVSGRTSVLLSLLMLGLVLADGAQDSKDHNTKEEDIFIKPTFFDFNKEVESIFPSKSEQSVKEDEDQSPDYILEEGVSLERDYDFYSDVSGSESEMVPVTARAGYSAR